MSGDVLLSILIASLESRSALLAHLSRELDRQITAADASSAVEIVPLADDGTLAVGTKRNMLIQMAVGRFVVFVDDDDSVSDEYVSTLVDSIGRHPEADCICFPAWIQFRGRKPRLMIHSITHTQWHEHDGRYLRPPSHITPIRRSIAQRYQFDEVDHSEDIDWSMRMQLDGVLKREVLLDPVLYIYHCRRPYAWQWLIDHTQSVRHAMGLRLANRIALRRKIRKLFLTGAPH